MTPNEDSIHFRLADAVCLLVIVGVAGFLVVTAVVLPPTLQMDNLEYLKLAENPGNFSEVRDIYAQRPLPCWIVFVLTRATGMSPTAAFRCVSGLSFVAFLVLFYASLICSRCQRLPSLVSTVFCAISAWPMPYSLSNVYQACDIMAYPLSLGFILALRHQAIRSAVIIATLSVVTRQQLVVLVVPGFLATYFQQQSRMAYVGLTIAISIFALNVALTRSGGESGLWEHTVAKLCRLDLLAEGARQTLIPLMFSPFCIVLAIEWRRCLKMAIRYWWVSLFSAACILQPHFAFDMTGASNAQRLAMLGVWPGIWLGSRLINDRLETRFEQTLYAACLPLYGTQHLVSQRAVFSSILRHRAVVNLLVAAIGYLRVWRKES